MLPTLRNSHSAGPFVGLPLCVRLSTVTRHGVRLQGNIRLLTATFYTLNPVRSCGDATGRTYFFSVRWLKAFLFAEHYYAFDRMCFYTGKCEATSALSSLNMLRCCVGNQSAQQARLPGLCRTNTALLLQTCPILISMLGLGF